MIDDLSPWNRLPLVKLVVNSYLANQEIYCVLRNQNSVPRSYEPAFGPYPEPH